MSESDKDKFAKLDRGLEWSGETAKRAIDDEKAYFAEHMPELEQLVRWWNIKMDEFNYGKEKLRIKEDYNKKKNGWVLYLFEPPTLTKRLVIQISLDSARVRRLGMPEDDVVLKVFSKNKLIHRENHLKRYNLKPLKMLMTRMIAQSSNYQDAIPDK